jgi:hypothetical protein
MDNEIAIAIETRDNETKSEQQHGGEKIDKPQKIEDNIIHQYINDNSILEAQNNDGLIQPHGGKEINEIIVSQYIEDNSIPSYVVTYSKEDNSIVGWNVEKNEKQLPDNVYFKLDRSYDIRSFLLYKRLLLFRYYGYCDSNDGEAGKYHYRYLKIIFISIFMSNK